VTAQIARLTERTAWKRLAAHHEKVSSLRLSCIVLGRGEDEKKVREWLTTAAHVPGFIGFAVGRTTFWDALVNWRAKKLTREAAVAEIARRFLEFVGIFEKAAN
jgi:myo-inositol catabolism protein IolC